MNRRIFMLGAAAGLGGCASRRGGPVKIRVSAYARLTSAAFHLAVEQGYFGQGGLELEIFEISDSVRSLPLLAGGKLEVSFGGLSPALINAVAKGANVRVVAGRNRAAPGCDSSPTLYANRNAFPEGWKDLRQLRGKRIGVSGLASVEGFGMDMILSTAGLSSADVDLKPLRSVESFAALVAGKLDAIVSTSFDKHPEAVSSNIVTGISLADVLPHFQYTYVMFGSGMLSADPSVGERFLGAYLRGAREFVAGKTPRFMYEFAESHGLDVRKVVANCRTNLDPDGEIDAESIRKYADWCVKKGYCPERVAPENLINARYLPEARRWAARDAAATGVRRDDDSAG